MKSYLEQAQDLKQRHSTWLSEIIEPIVENNPTWMQEGHADCKTTYRKNNYGLRCDDFTKINSDQNHILFAGCERTIPMNINEEDGWAKKMYNKICLSENEYRNISYPGASIHKIVSNLYKYFNLIGNPKEIYLLAPEIIRDLGFWEEHKIFKPKIFYQYRPEINDGVEHNIMCVPNNTPMQLLGIRYLHTMRAFEQYCEAAGIKLHWTSWDLQTNEFLSNYRFKYFIKSEDNLVLQEDIFNFFVENKGE